jgi:hypothetical protein
MGAAGVLLHQTMELMMSAHVYGDDAVPRDTDAGEEEPGFALSFDENAIEELLYGRNLPPEERLEQLQALRVELDAMRSADIGDDPRDLLGEVDRAIASLTAGMAHPENAPLDETQWEE